MSSDRLAGKAANCFTGVVGFDEENQVREISVNSGGAVKDVASSSPLSFVPTNMGLYGSSSSEKSGKLYLKATTEDGRPRIVVLKYPASKPGVIRVDDDSVRFAVRDFTPRLFTASYGYHVFAVEGSKLVRYNTWFKRNGKLHFIDRKVLLRGVGDLETLANYNRVKLHGRKTDVLMATSSTGRLLQIQVPVKKPGKTKVNKIIRNGFAEYDELSLGGCNKGKKMFFAAIDRDTSTLTTYTLSHRYDADRSDVTEKDTLGPDTNWNLNAVF